MTAAKKSAGKKKRTYHHGDLRSALLEAARQELHEVGWRELSLRSVARRAGVTHTAAYHHFADKNALLVTIAIEGFVRLDSYMAQEMEAAGADPVERLLASGDGYLRMAAEDPLAYDLMFNGVARQIPERSADQPDAFQRLLDAVKAARQATGRTDDDALSDAMMHWELVHGCAMLMRIGAFAQRGITLQEHGRYLRERLRALYQSQTLAR